MDRRRWRRVKNQLLPRAQFCMSVAEGVGFEQALILFVFSASGRAFSTYSSTHNGCNVEWTMSSPHFVAVDNLPLLSTIRITLAR